MCKMNYRNVPLLVLILLTAFSCADEEVGISPAYRDLTAAVYSTVTVEPLDLYTAYAPVSGVVEERFISEGETVAEGATMLVLRKQQIDLQAENARLNRELARANYEGEATLPRALEEQVAAAKSKYLNDSLRYQRQLRLWQQDIGSRQELEARQLSVELSKRELLRLENELQRTSDQLKWQLKLAENALRQTSSQQSDFIVRSRMDGRVYELFKKPGELVSPQTPIASIGHADSFLLKLLIDEVDIAKIHIGQKAIVQLDAYQDSVFYSTISRIYPTKDERSQTFLVEATFDRQPAQLYMGLSGEANIVLAQRSQVLTVPRLYVSKDGTVRTAQGELKVQTGFSDLQYVEITAGLDTSMLIYQAQ